MSGLRGKMSLALVAALVVALGALAVLAGCGGTARTSFAPAGEVTQGGAPDSPAVVLGGYTFGSTSDRLTHPYYKFTATTAPVTMKGWGQFAGQQMTVSFASGGSVAGVKTVRTHMTRPDGGEEYNWYAQDTQGNVHMLQKQEPPDPVRLKGVAAGLKPRFELVKNSLLTVGYVWYTYEDSSNHSRKTRRFKVLSTTASVRGQTGLLRLQDISDEDGNGDGVFDPSWGGPDRRQDLYYQKTGSSGMFNVTMCMDPAGGFQRK